MKKLCTAALLAALAAPAALALINPNFTPIHLVEQSERVLVLKLGPATAKGEIPVALGECLKGKKPEKAPTLDLSKTPKPQAEALARIVGNRQAPALLFSGQFRNEGPDAGGAQPGGERLARLGRAGGEGEAHPLASQHAGDAAADAAAGARHDARLTREVGVTRPGRRIREVICRARCCGNG